MNAVGSSLRELDGATVWLNSEPLTAAGLRGQRRGRRLLDLLVRQLAAHAALRPGVGERYRDRGLVVVGAHAPEFGFEHDLDNVRRAMRRAGGRLPGRDRQRASRSGGRSTTSYWPALYLVDGDGRVRFHHFGEGAYEETEAAIQQLLGVDGEPVRVDADRHRGRRRLGHAGSPETYLGYARGERRAGDGADGLALNQWALAGEWTVGEEAAVLEAAGGSIAYRFQARDLNLVLTPPTAGRRVRFTVRLDGQPPGDAHGLDVDALGDGTVSEPRMYQLVRQRGAVAERTFEITFLDPGVARLRLHLRLTEELTYNRMVVDELTDEEVDRLFHALADATRRDILRRCVRGEPSVSRLADDLPDELRRGAEARRGAGAGRPGHQGAPRTGAARAHRPRRRGPGAAAPRRARDGLARAGGPDGRPARGGPRETHG